MVPVNVPAKFEVCIASHVPEKIEIGVLGGGCEAPILAKTRPYGVVDCTI